MWRPSGLAGLDKLKQILPVSRSRAVTKDYTSRLTAPTSTERTPRSYISDTVDQDSPVVEDDRGWQSPMAVNLTHPESSCASSPSSARRNQHATSRKHVSLWGLGSTGNQGQAKSAKAKNKISGVVVDVHTLRAAQAASKARQEQIGHLKKDLTKSLFSTFPKDDLKQVGVIEGKIKRKAIITLDNDSNDKFRSHKSLLMELLPRMVHARSWGKAHSMADDDSDDDDGTAAGQQELTPQEEMIRQLAKSTAVSTLDVEEIYEQYMNFLGANCLDGLLEIGKQSRALLKVLRPDDPDTKAAADELEALKDANASKNPGNPAEKVEFSQFFTWFIRKFPDAVQKEDEEEAFTFADLNGAQVRRSDWGGVCHSWGSGVSNGELPLDALGLSGKMRISGMNQDLGSSAKTPTERNPRLTVLDETRTTVANSFSALGDIPKPERTQLMLTGVEAAPQE